MKREVICVERVHNELSTYPRLFFDFSHCCITYIFALLIKRLNKLKKGNGSTLNICQKVFTLTYLPPQQLQWEISIYQFLGTFHYFLELPRPIKANPKF